MPLRVRFARAEDYPAAATIHNEQNHPDFHLDAQRMLLADRRSAARDPAFRRLIGEANGEVVGTGYFRANWAGTVQAGRYWVGLFVSPEWRDRGVDAQMLRYALEEAGEEARELASCIREDFVAQAGYLDSFGFEERFRSWGAHLDLAAFDPQRFEPSIAELEKSGIRFVPYSELESDSRRDRKLLKLKRQIDRDVLSFEPIVPSESEDILGDDYIREGMVIAVDEAGDYVGLASLRRDSPEGGLGCGLTGVLPRYRNRGIATALKVRSLVSAMKLGATEIGTGGGGVDTAMLRVNRKLGFEVGSLWVTFISDR